VFHVKHRHRHLSALLRAGVFEAIGFTLTPGQLERLFALVELLLSWSSRMNLTAVRTPEGIVTRHLLDSLMARPHLAGAKNAIDVGSGAGFPGLPLAIACPETQFTLVEASRKKASFIEFALAALALSNAACVRDRAESAGASPRHHKAYDVAIARGVVALRRLIPLVRPFLRPMGWAVVFLRTTGSELQETRDVEECWGDTCSIAFDLRHSDTLDWTRRFLIVKQKANGASKGGDAGIWPGASLS